MPTARKTSFVYGLVYFMFAAGPFVMLPGANNPYYLAKSAFFICGSFLALTAAALSRMRQEDRLPPPHILMATMLLLAIWTCISSAQAHTAWFAALEALRIISFPALFFAAVASGIDSSRMKRLLSVSVAAAAAISAIGILQYYHILGYGGFAWHDRTASLFDDPNSLGGYLAWNLAGAFGMFAAEKNGVRRAAYAVAAIAIACCIILSNSRSAWFSTAAAFMAAAAYLLSMKGMPVFKRMLPLIAAALIAVIAFAAVISLKDVNNQNIAKRISLAASSASVSGEGHERVVGQHAGMHMASDHWFFGVGPGNYQVFIQRYIALGADPDRPESKPLFLVHAYNDYVTMAAETGLPGIVFWAGTLLITIVALWKVAAKDAPAEQKAVAAACIAAAAECIVRAGVFQSIIRNPLELSPLAVFAAYAISERTAPADTGGKSRALTVATAAAAVALLAFSLIVYSKALIANIYLDKSMVAADNKDFKTALNFAEKQYAIAPGDPYGAAQLAQTLQMNRSFDQAVRMYDRAIQGMPHFVDIYAQKGFTLMSAEKYTEASTALDKAVELAPYDSRTLILKGYALYNLKQYTKAIPFFEQALYFSREDSRAEFYLAMCYFNTGQKARAGARLRHVVAVNPDFADAHYNLAATALDGGNLKEAEKALKNTLRLRPGYGEALAMLAYTYFRMGNPDKAETAFDEILKKSGCSVRKLSDTGRKPYLTKDNFESIYDKVTRPGLKCGR